MNDSEVRHDAAVDRLVRDYLLRQAESLDATALVERLRRSRTRLADSTLETVSTSPARSSFRRRWSTSLTWCFSSVLAVTIAFLGGRYLTTDSANAALALRDVQSVHAGAIDRCYRVQYAPDPRSWDGRNKLDGPSQSVLWTRGDRFWSDCTIGDVRLQIGRDELGTFWVSPSRTKGIRWEKGEAGRLPEAVALIAAINSMSVPRLVDDVLADFELRADRLVRPDGDVRTVIWATLKPDHSHPHLSHALLEIDNENDLLVRLVLWMVRDGQPRGTVTYTLLESSRRDDEQYRLAAHLDAEATIEEHVWPSVEGSSADQR